MSLVFQEQSEDRQFEPGREHFIFPPRPIHTGRVEDPAALVVASFSNVDWGCTYTREQVKMTSAIGVEPVDEGISDEPYGLLISSQSPSETNSIPHYVYMHSPTRPGYRWSTVVPGAHEFD
jgi:hypothetical protein